MMKLFSFRNVYLVLAALFTLTVSACGGNSPDSNNSTLTSVQNQPSAYDIVSKDAKGFSVGSTMSSNAVYVMFDPQCPHCASLWQASLALHNKVKFIWIPVAFLNSKSKPQGAAILGSTNSLAAMTLHENSLQAGTGGIELPNHISIEIDIAISKNTDLMNTVGANSVPYIIARHAQTGSVVTQAGALTTSGLASFLGVQ